MGCLSIAIAIAVCIYVASVSGEEAGIALFVVYCMLTVVVSFMRGVAGAMPRAAAFAATWVVIRNLIRGSN
jgi:hypothetical protein